MKSRKALVGACAIIAGFTGMARADILTLNMDRDSSAVDATANQVVAGMTVMNMMEGVSADVTLQSPVVHFASTGGPHIGLAFNVDRALSDNEFSFASRAKSDGLDGTGEIGRKIGAAAPSVPEAPTWAMMGLGFAGLVFAGYRARRRPISIV